MGGGVSKTEVTMRFLRNGILTALCLAAPMLAVDADLLRYAGPDTKEIAGVYADRVITSPLGIFLQSMAGTENRDFTNFITATGFDPRRDLREIMVVPSAEAPGTRSGLIAARGTFNGAQLGALAVLSGGNKETYDGVDIYFRGGGRHGGAWFAFPEPSIVLVGDEASVKAAIARRTTPSQLDARLMEKAQSASSQQDIWFAAIGRTGIGLGKQFVPLESLDVISGGLTLGSVVQLNAEAVMRTEKDAQALLGIFKMVSGMLQLQQQKNPDLAKLMLFLQNADAKVDGPALHFSTFASESDIEQLLRSNQKFASIR
jgi:hypothetical protein